MLVQMHGVLQMSTGVAILSATPIFVSFDGIGRVVPGGASNQTITVTASTGNSWFASITYGNAYTRINNVTDGTASGSGNGSFTVDMLGLISGSRYATVVITSSAPNITIDLDQVAE